MTLKTEPLCPMRHALSFAASDICTQFSVIRYLSTFLCYSATNLMRF